MKYKTVYQFRWVLIVVFLVLIYLSNLILIKLPFISLNFPAKSNQSELLVFLMSYLPRLDFEMQVYNIQTVVVWACGVICGPRMSFLTLSIYLLLGFFGLPLFASGGGFDYYKEPTFGYLISLPILAFSSGWLFERNQKFLAIFVPILTTHLMGILFLLLFKQSWLDISWYLSFSSISYDLIFALILTPLMPYFSFILREMVIQEVPTRDLLKVIYDSKDHKTRITRNVL